MRQFSSRYAFHARRNFVVSTPLFPAAQTISSVCVVVRLSLLHILGGVL